MAVAEFGEAIDRFKKEALVAKREHALVVKKQAAALKEAQELAAENAAREARFAEREAKLKAEPVSAHHHRGAGWRDKANIKSE